MYVFDLSSLIVLFDHFYPDRFPSLWSEFDRLVGARQITSVREVYKEILEKPKTSRLVEWAKQCRPLFFPEPTVDELAFVREIFRVRHFSQLVEKKKILKGKPVADPFLIARAKCLDATLITQEQFRRNGAKIPNVCEYFKVTWTDLEGFMEEQEWRF